MNCLKIDINNLPDKHLKELIINLDNAFRKFGIDFYLIGARVLGRQMADILAQSEKLEKRIITILGQNTTDIENSRMGTIIASKYNIDLITAVKLLEDLLSGINDVSHSV